MSKADDEFEDEVQEEIRSIQRYQRWREARKEAKRRIAEAVPHAPSDPPDLATMLIGLGSLTFLFGLIVFWLWFIVSFIIDYMCS